MAEPRACPTCSGATDVPDGRGGIMPCPDCQPVGRSARAILTGIAESGGRMADAAKARLKAVVDDRA